MRRKFWKATGVSFAAYAVALLAGFGIDFRLALFSLLALQVTWTSFCIGRLVQLRFAGAHRRDAEPFAREDYGFALGGSTSSLVLLCVMIVLTQIV